LICALLLCLWLSIGWHPLGGMHEMLEDTSGAGSQTLRNQIAPDCTNIKAVITLAPSSQSAVVQFWHTPVFVAPPTGVGGLHGLRAA
jgi:hypothetical protein